MSDIQLRGVALRKVRLSTKAKSKFNNLEELVTQMNGLAIPALLEFSETKQVTMYENLKELKGKGLLRPEAVEVFDSIDFIGNVTIEEDKETKMRRVISAVLKTSVRLYHD